MIRVGSVPTTSLKKFVSLRTDAIFPFATKKQRIIITANTNQKIIPVFVDFFFFVFFLFSVYSAAFQ